MEASQFEKLEEKVELALRVISQLNQTKTALQQRLQESEMKILELEETNQRLQNSRAELETSLNEKSSNMAQAGEKIQSLITKLEEEDLEGVLQ